MSAIELNAPQGPGEDNSLPLNTSVIAQASKVLVESGQEAATLGVNAIPGFVHDQTGVTSDFIPDPSKRQARPTSLAKEMEIDSPPVVLDDREMDFIPQGEAVIRDVVDVAQQKIADSIMLEHEAQNKQFEKAKNYIEHCRAQERLTEKQEQTLPKAIALVEKGQPMSRERALELALERMRGGTTEL